MGSRVYGSTQDYRQGLKGLRHDIRVKHTQKTAIANVNCMCHPLVPLSIGSWHGVQGPECPDSTGGHGQWSRGPAWSDPGQGHSMSTGALTLSKDVGKVGKPQSLSKATFFVGQTRQTTEPKILP